jgi:hypothetical protein
MPRIERAVFPWSDFRQTKRLTSREDRRGICGQPDVLDIFKTQIYASIQRRNGVFESKPCPQVGEAEKEILLLRK